MRRSESGIAGKRSAGSPARRPPPALQELECHRAPAENELEGKVPRQVCQCARTLRTFTPIQGFKIVLPRLCWSTFNTSTWILST